MSPLLSLMNSRRVVHSQILRAACLAVVVLTAAGCSPKASVKSTTPIANLQTYQVALVRIATAPGFEQYSSVLEYATAESLLSKCSFSRVVSPTQLGNLRPDLIVDLNIRRTQRGGDGFISNPNVAKVDVAMVLSDGIDDALLGSAELQGKSSAVSMNNADPESQALVAVAKRISAILAQSGCFGQRMARAAPAPTPAPVIPAPGTPTITPEQIAQAEAANAEGKRLFRAADIPAAKEQFLQAVRIVVNPKYLFNLCLVHEALSEFDLAVRACNAVIGAKAEQRLAAKATQRLEIIAEKRGA